MIIQGDAYTELKRLDSDSIDLICCDPPYGYSFMGKDWDKAVIDVETWKECLRVLKAGAFAFIMSSPRQDVLCKMVLNLIDAGFETNFSSIYWAYASGFPKAADVSKLIEKRNKDGKKLEGAYCGFQPKPAVEVILTIMKPLSEKTYVDQALTNGKGVTWLDDCRIPYQANDTPNSRRAQEHDHTYISKEQGQGGIMEVDYSANDKGRFPANLLVSDDVLNNGKITTSKSRLMPPDQPKDNRETLQINPRKLAMVRGHDDSGQFSRYFSLDKWAEKTFPFLIIPKASKSEKNKGLETLGVSERQEARPDSPYDTGVSLEHDHRMTGFNNHPTVKPLKLMSYLITMGSREGDTVLDPFCGSGTTLIAAHILHRKYIGIELNEDYAKIAEKRLEPYLKQTRLNING